MGISLVLALLAGIGVMMLREGLCSSGNSDTWNQIYRFLFADITTDSSAIGILYIIGQLFIRALSLIIVPMIFTSLTMAILRISDASKLRRISLKTLGIFLLTTYSGFYLLDLLDMRYIHRAYFAQI